MKADECVPLDNADGILREEDANGEEEFQDEQEQAPIAVTLPTLLKSLFGLNGMTLGLETLALMYIVNSRVEMPLPYMATYGAIAFLPYSLKPIYGYLTERHQSRFQLFVCLLFANGLSLALTCLIPKGGIFLAFVVAFFRGVTDSWAELCLGLTLIDHARVFAQDRNHSSGPVVAKLQAEAATSRNIGSFLGHIVTFLVFLHRHFSSPDQTQLSGAVANTFLISTGLLQMLGVLAACLDGDVFHPSPTRAFTLIGPVAEDDLPDVPDEESALRADDDSFPSYSSHDSQEDQTFDSVPQQHGLDDHQWRANGVLVVLLQAALLVFAMKGPVSETLSTAAWKTILSSLLVSSVALAVLIYSREWWYATHRVGLYLILKHAVPSDSMVWGSFVYSLFENNPLQLQFLSLIGMGVLTGASWAYGKLLAPHNSGRPFLLVIAGTTILAATASLGNIVVFQNSTSQLIFWIAMVFKSIETFFGEWEFLPDVVLATTSVVENQSSGLESRPASRSTEDESEDSGRNTAVEYGTLISCIDFGGQLGSLLSGPLVAILGITRENNFQGLDKLVALGSFFSFLSLLLIPLLRKG